MYKRIIILLFLLNFSLVILSGATYYVSKSGNDNNPGTIDRPWATWQKAFDAAQPGDTVFIRGGVYYPAVLNNEEGVFINGKSGYKGKMINIWAYPGERPVLDVSVITGKITSNYGIFMESSNFWHLKGLEFTGASQHQANMIAVGVNLRNSSHNILEQIKSYNNQGPGFRLLYKCAGNVLLNCDSYNNYDPYTGSPNEPGGNADGFVIPYGEKGDSTILKGCRSWFNSDDGYDTFGNEGIFIFENCWSFLNGRGSGDGDGFKLGATYLSPDPAPQKILTRCMSFMNRNHGFNANGSDVLMVFYNNIAFRNKYYGFEFSNDNVKNIFRNNIADSNNLAGANFDVNLMMNMINDHNSWNIDPSFQWNNGTNYKARTNLSSDNFFSIDTSGVSGRRGPNGELPDTDFLRLRTGSKYIDSGISVGLSFAGTAPDLGPVESGQGTKVPVPVVNQAPVINPIPDQVIDQGTTFPQLSLNNYVNDPDNNDNDLIWTFTGNKALAISYVPSSNIATFTLRDPQWSGTETITFKSTDRSGAFDTEEVSFTVKKSNFPPLLGEIPDQKVAEGYDFAQIDLNNYLTDQNNRPDQISWTFTGNVNLSVSYNPKAGTASVTPKNPEWNGTERITFRASDPDGMFDLKEVSFTVIPVNDPPVVISFPNQNLGKESMSITIDLNNFVSDPDNSDDQINWSCSGNYRLMVNIDQTRKIAVITPKNVEWSGTENITFRATDPGNLFDEKTVSYTVEGLNGTGTTYIDYKVQVYPNPSSGIFSVYVNNTENIYYHLFIADLTGKKVYEKNYLYGKQYIDVSFLKKGTYLLNILINNKKITKKIIIQ